MVSTKEEWARALAERHGVELQRKFSSAAVAVCGLGGLGSNIAVSLARAGVGRLMLIDFDRVDLTNLHRQQNLIFIRPVSRKRMRKNCLRALTLSVKLLTMQSPKPC